MATELVSLELASIVELLPSALLALQDDVAEVRSVAADLVAAIAVS